MFKKTFYLALFLITTLATTSCIVLDGVKFPETYRTENKGQYTMEIPEVQELVHIIMALTPTGINDSNMVDHTTRYYKRVREYFKPYEQEPMVNFYENEFKSIIMNRGLTYRLHKMDACGFYFEGDKIVKDTKYPSTNGSAFNFIQPHTGGLEEFVKKTKFREFYAQNKPYYDSLITAANKQMPIKAMWAWLEERFPGRYDNYRITFSPLTGGSHSTTRFITDNFSQTLMFVSRPFLIYTFSDGVAEGLMTRVVFTEIDHNYVNPVSDTFVNEINQSFAKREIWAKKGTFADDYGSIYSVFNEYMTWAVFTLYAEERLGKADFDYVNERTEALMENYRGFPKYRAFNTKLREFYKAQQTKNIVELYKPMLDWAKQQ